MEAKHEADQLPSMVTPQVRRVSTAGEEHGLHHVCRGVIKVQEQERLPHGPHPLHIHQLCVCVVCCVCVVLCVCVILEECKSCSSILATLVSGDSDLATRYDRVLGTRSLFPSMSLDQHFSHRREMEF